MWKLCEIQILVFINKGVQPGPFIYILSLDAFTFEGRVEWL